MHLPFDSLCKVSFKCQNCHNCNFYGPFFLFSRYKYAKDRAQRMVVIPRYEPVFVEPNLKEYETQVLQMSVAIDDDNSGDLKLDFSNRSHVFDPGFNLDSVSYITHETSASK